MRVGSDGPTTVAVWGEREAVGVVTSSLPGVQPHPRKVSLPGASKKTIGGAPGERVPHQAA